MNAVTMRPAATRAPRLSRTLRDLVADFRRGVDGGVRVWHRSEAADWSLVDGDPASAPAHPDALAAVTGSERLYVEVPGADALAAFLAATLARTLRLESEVVSISREIAERYEEITLLYSISEILGSVISLGEAARTILAEVLSTLGAGRAALWLYMPDARRLELVAAVGGDGQPGPILVDDGMSVTAAVFRDQRPLLLGPDEVAPLRAGAENDRATPRTSFLSVPVSYTPPEGDARTIGVINLVGRRTDEPFSAGDVKLLLAIASQIGAAVENNRLVADSVRQERFRREMELAHDLQLKLLPATQQFDGFAEVAARCVPADSVGGDFYHLFRLPGGRLGVMIGDVSSHGFGAALIMALTMSAVAIHASEGDPPADVLRRVHHALIDELENTEMFLTLFYGVIDPAAGRLTYANAGHAHALVVPPDGPAQRLSATNVPLGMADLDGYTEASVAWDAGRDLLFLFTDGLADALGLGEVEGERCLLRILAEQPGAPVERLAERLFALPQAGDTPSDDRTAVLVRL
jgi:phosphoserine phosphatase RsbU/P